LLLKFKQKFGKGLSVAWYRDVVRPKILETPPVTGLDNGDAEIHVLTSRQDWMNLIWTLKSFYRCSEKPYRLVIHEDGSLTGKEWAQLKKHFPDASFVERKEADVKVAKALQDFPKALHFRQTNALSLKIMDFPLYLQSERLILLDSDVLFYRRPAVLMDRIEDGSYKLNTVNRDVEGALTVDAKTVEKLYGFRLLECYNSGLGLIHKGSLRYDWMEEFLGIPGIIGHWWRIEQTLFALCSCRYGAELLPEEYDVYLGKGLGNRPSRHYVGAVRHLMYSEGMRKLSADGILKRG